LRAALSASRDAPAVRPLEALPRRRRAACALLEREAEEHAKHRKTRGDVGPLCDRALVEVAGGDTTRASEDLHTALERDPRSARAASDLAAVLLERATRGELELFVAALDAASRAVEIDGRLPEAQFNLALTLERNFLPHLAAGAWHRYLELDSDSAWATEARRHLPPLETWRVRRPGDELEAILSAALDGNVRALDGFATQDAQPLLRLGEESLLPAWARETITGARSAAHAHLEAARSIGTALAHRGDHSLEDAVAAILRAAGSAERTLAEAHLLYQRGTRLCGQEQADAGTDLLARSRATFEGLRSPYRHAATLALASCACTRRDYPTALALVAPLLAGEELSRYPSLIGKGYWIEGLARISTGEPAPAIRAYRPAREAFERAGLAGDAGAVNTLLHEAFVDLGDEENAWNYLHSGMSAAFKARDPRRLYVVLDKAADEAARQGASRAERWLHDEVVWLSADDPGDAGLGYARVRKANGLLRSGRLEDAARELAAADGDCRKVEQSEERSRCAADAMTMEARVKLASREPAAALELLGQGLAVYRAQSFGYYLIEACLLRARALHALRRDAEALRDVEAGLAEFERQRKSVDEERLRLAFSEARRDLLDLAIDLLSGHEEGAGAFEYAERAHGRILLETIDQRVAAGPVALEHGATARPDPIRPLSMKEVQRALPAEVTLVEYALLDDRLLAWVLRRDSAGLARLAVARGELEPRITALLAELEQGRDSARLRELEEALFQALVAPLARDLAGTVIFVPDRALSRVPFAALRDPASSRYFVQDHASAIAASATLYVLGLARDREIARRQQGLTALLIGDPEFDRRVYSTLEPLPDARAEAQKIARLYGRQGDLRVGVAAGRDALLRGAAGRTVLHIASHALANLLHPDLAALPLAPTAGDDGTLYARDVVRLPLGETRLVVLAGCGTGTGRATAGEGMLSLSRAFLAAGVPSAAATLWDIHDERSMALFYRLHQSLLAGKSPVDALNAAQLALLHGPDPALRSPAVWGAVEVFNGTEPLVSR
jgi:CHAT domain-containing protein